MRARRGGDPRSGTLAPLFDRIGRDRTRSARELGLELLEGLERWTGSEVRREPTIRAREAREIGQALGRLQPAMAVFRRWSREWSAVLRRSPPSRVVHDLRGWVRTTQRSLAAEPRRLARVMEHRLPPHARILTISRSRTLLEALARLPPSRRPREVLAMESLPGGEGRTFARELRGCGLPARTVPDRETKRGLGPVDLVLIGADSLGRDGSVVHKVGTRPLALAARRAGVPLVVVAGRSKEGAVPRTLPALFDRTPASLVSEYWTDRGPEKGRGVPLQAPRPEARGRRDPETRLRPVRPRGRIP